MVDLTAEEIKVLLWAISVIDASFGGPAPHESAIERAKAKLVAELFHAEE